MLEFEKPEDDEVGHGVTGQGRGHAPAPANCGGSDEEHQTHLKEEQQLHQANLEEEARLRESHERLETEFRRQEEDLHQTNLREEGLLRQSHQREEQEDHGHQEPAREPEIIKLFVNNLHRHDFPRTATVGEVIAIVFGGNGGHIFHGDAEEPLEIDIVIGDIISGKHGHIHASRCKQVEVVVKYGGGKHDHTFSASKTVRDVLDWAVRQEWKGSQIDQAERPKLALYLPDQKDPLKDDLRLGTLVSEPEKGQCHDAASCRIVLEMALRVRHQG